MYSGPVTESGAFRAFQAIIATAAFTVFVLYIQLFIKDAPSRAVTALHKEEWHITRDWSTQSNGVNKSVVLINGESPGPELHLAVGEELHVTVCNHMAEFTSMHWHGIEQARNNHMDGAVGITECGIPPGENFTYVVPLDNPGTFWYHAHHHFQQMEGMLGALIVYGSGNEALRKDPVVILQDRYDDASVADIFSHYMSRASSGFEPVPNTASVNGLTWFNNAGGYAKVARNNNGMLRIINSAALADFWVSVDETAMTVHEADSTRVLPRQVQILTISPGQRYSVELSGSKGPVWLRAIMDIDNFRYFPEHFDAQTKAVVGNTDQLPTSQAWDGEYPDVTVLDPNTLKPYYLDPPAPVPDITLQVSIQTMKLEQVDLAPFEFFNRTTFTPAIGAPNLHVLKGMADPHYVEVPTVSAPNREFGGSQLIPSIPHKAVVELIINNPDDSDHPIHMHGHDFWVMYTRRSTSGLGKWSPKYIPQYRYTPLKRDTHVVPALGHSVIRWEANNPGVWAFHCHVLWHHAAGLMMQFAQGMSHFNERIPQKQLDFCRVQRAMGSKLVYPLPKPGMSNPQPGVYA